MAERIPFTYPTRFPSHGDEAYARIAAELLAPGSQPVGTSGPTDYGPEGLWAGPGYLDNFQLPPSPLPYLYVSPDDVSAPKPKSQPLPPYDIGGTQEERDMYAAKQLQLEALDESLARLRRQMDDARGGDAYKMAMLEAMRPVGARIPNVSFNQTDTFGVSEPDLHGAAGYASGFSEAMQNIPKISASGGDILSAMKSMAVESSGEKRKDLSAAERQELASLNDMKRSLGRAKEIIDKYKEYFGYGGIGEDFQRIRNYWGIDTPDAKKRRELDSELNELAAWFQRAISGAQMTDAEAERFKRFLPNPSKDYATSIKDLERLRKMVDDKINSRISGYSGSGFVVPDFASGSDLALSDDSGYVLFD